MGNTYYVSAANGNNNNPGTDPAKALRTIQAAINKLQAGDTVAVRQGVYAERLHIQKPGTAEAPIVIAAYEGEQPVIDGADLDIPEDAALVVIQQSQDVTLTGLSIRHAGGRGLFIRKSSRVVVRQCAIETCDAAGLDAGQCDTLLIEKCVIHDCARRFLAHSLGRQNIALFVHGSSDVTIQENRVYENGEDGICVGVGCRGVIVRRNVCYDNRNGQIGVTSSVGVVVDSNLCYHTGRAEFLNLNERRGPAIKKRDLERYREDGPWHTRDLKVINNIVVGCSSGFATERDAGPLNDFLLAHNTILNSTEQAIQIGLSDPSRRSFIENNLIATNNGGDMVRGPAGPGIVWRNNLWSSFPGTDVYNPTSDVLSADAGLIDLSAPLRPGQVTPDPYKLINGSAAINRGVRRKGLADFWGAPRDGQPDIGANEFPGGAGDEVEDPTLPNPGVRVTAGLQALYEFKEGQGQQVRDVGGVSDPLHLRIVDTGRVAWGSNGLEVKQSTLITSESPARKIINACRASGELTIEAWIQPANVDQEGPARIVSISNSKTLRNFTLGQGLYGGQPMDLYMARLRTGQTSTNGLPAVITPAGSATTSLTHVAYTRRANGRATLYVNGQERGVLTVSGDLAGWDERMPLLLANELSEDRPWLGVLNLVAVFSRALSAAEIVHNYEAGFVAADPVTAQFTVAGATRGVAPFTVEVDASASAAEAGIAAYFWEFGDGQTSDQATAANTYAAAGVYDVSLTVTDTNGRTDKLTRERFITVVGSPIPPLPVEYARFLLVDVSDATVVAFGLQYPDLRCSLMWNGDPFPMMAFAELDDVLSAYQKGSVELIWVDEREVP